MVPPLGIAKSREMTAEIPARKRFCILYTERDRTICRCDGLSSMAASETLRRIVPPEHWGPPEKFRAHLVEWMKGAKPGDIKVPGGEAVIVRTR